MQQASNVGVLEANPAAAGCCKCHDTALALVFCTIPPYELYITVPLVCRAWNEVATRAYGTRALSVTSSHVKGVLKTQSLAKWIQRHSSQLLQMQFTGFMNSGSTSWWSNMWSAPFQQLQQLSLRACGAPLHPLPLQLLASMTSLQVLKLEHIKCPVDPAALSACSSITQLVARSCGLGTHHLAAIGQLRQLVQLALPANDFVSCSSSDAAQYTCTAAAEAEEHASASSASAGSATGSGTARHAASDHGHDAAVDDHLAQSPSSLQKSPATWIHSLQQLRRLDFSKCRLPAGTLDDLPCLTNLTNLNLAHCQLNISTSRGPGQLLKLQRLPHAASGATGGEADQRVAVGSSAAASCADIGRMSNLLELDVSYVTNACEQLCRGAQCCEVRPALRMLNVEGTGYTSEQLEDVQRCFASLVVLRS